MSAAYLKLQVHVCHDAQNQKKLDNINKKLQEIMRQSLCVEDEESDIEEFDLAIEFIRKRVKKLTGSEQLVVEELVNEVIKEFK